MADSGRQRVVFIDDDPDMVNLVTLMLDQNRFDVVGASDGVTGLNLMHQTPPDVVLLDLMLPDMGGWDIYQVMRDDPDLADIPVIIVTAQNTPIYRILGERVAQVQFYITKPFSPTTLRNAVDAALSGETQ